MTDRQRGSRQDSRPDREADGLTASDDPTPAPRVPTTGRVPLRLSVAEQPGEDRLDGGWWPQSRDLKAELADLVEHFPARWGRIMCAVVCRSDWADAPRHVLVAGGNVRVGSFEGDAAHVVDLVTTDREVLRLLVVPSDFTRGQGEEALLAAATAGNAHSATDLLDEVTAHPDSDPSGRWTDDGEPWWGPESVAPSFRPGE